MTFNWLKKKLYDYFRYFNNEVPILLFKTYNHIESKKVDINKKNVYQLTCYYFTIQLLNSQTRFFVSVITFDYYSLREQIVK